jgi:hypothetical protein
MGETFEDHVFHQDDQVVSPSTDREDETYCRDKEVSRHLQAGM